MIVGTTNWLTINKLKQYFISRITTHTIIFWEGGTSSKVFVSLVKDFRQNMAFFVKKCL